MRQGQEGVSQGPADPGWHKLPVAIPLPRRRNGSPHRWRDRPRGPSTAARRIPLGAEQPQPGPPPVEGVAEAPRGSAKPISIRASMRGCRSPMTVRPGGPIGRGPGRRGRSEAKAAIRSGSCAHLACSWESSKGSSVPLRSRLVPKPFPFAFISSNSL